MPFLLGPSQSNPRPPPVPAGAQGSGPLPAVGGGGSLVGARSPQEPEGGGQARCAAGWSQALTLLAGPAAADAHLAGAGLVLPSRNAAALRIWGRLGRRRPLRRRPGAVAGAALHPPDFPAPPALAAACSERWAGPERRQQPGFLPWPPRTGSSSRASLVEGETEAWGGPSHVQVTPDGPVTGQQRSRCRLPVKISHEGPWLLGPGPDPTS